MASDLRRPLTPRPLHALIDEGETVLGRAVLAELAERQIAGSTPPPGEDPAEAVGPEITHVFVGLARPVNPAQVARWIEALGATPHPARLVLRGRLVDFRRAHLAPLSESSLPFTWALCPRVSEEAPRPDLGARLREASGRLLRALSLGYRGHDHLPIGARELAFGLVHTGLGFSTIGRCVQGLELRQRSSSDRSYGEPVSRRDSPRH